MIHGRVLNTRRTLKFYTRRGTEYTEDTEGVIFKMIFIGYLFGIRSERQLVRDIEVNVSYR